MSAPEVSVLKRWTTAEIVMMSRYHQHIQIDGHISSIIPDPGVCISELRQAITLRFIRRSLWKQVLSGVCVKVNVCVLMFVSRSSSASLGRLQWGGDDPATDPRSVSGEQELDTLHYCVNTIAVLPFLVECLLSDCRTREISCGTLRLVSSSTSTWSRCILWLQWCWRKTSSSTACALTWFQNSQYSSCVCVCGCMQCAQCVFYITCLFLQACSSGTI